MRAGEASRRRNPFRRPIDYVIVVLIVVASTLVGTVLWQRGDSHNTVLVAGPANLPVLAEPSRFPPSLAEFWSRPSAATPVPVVAGPSVITADNGAVIGRDPLTGDQRWSYTRDLPLCTVAAAFSRVIAVYHRSTCNEVSELDATSGVRDAQRNGDAQLGTALITDGTYVTATGPTLLDTWRSDLVQTMEYGDVPDLVNPDRQPRTGCSYGSVAMFSGVIGVIERCDGDDGDRLTLYKAMNKDADTPSVVFTTVVGDKGARIVAMNDQFVAVLVPGPTRLAVFNAQNGSQITQYPLDLPAGDLTGDPAGRIVPVTVGPSATYWFSGSRTVALSTTDFRPLWTVPDTLGPGTVFAGRYLVPVSNALLVLDQASGARIGQIGVDRHGYEGIVTMASAGPVVFEQRGPTLAALH